MADNASRPTGGENVPPPAAIAQAISDISDRANVLIREEIELARVEVTTKVVSLLKGAAVGIAAGIFVAIGMMFVLNGFAWLAWYEFFPDNQFFWGFFVVAGFLFLLGATAGFLAAKALKAGQDPKPQMAIREAQLIKDTVTSPRPEDI